MNVCPPEIHSYIALLASESDEGHTIRSLSLVSRYFYQIAHPLLYNSISISGAYQILALAETLEAFPNTQISQVFISDDNDRPPKRNGAIQIPETALSTAINRILSLSAPTVRSLTLLLSASSANATSLFARLLRTSFPDLHELTLSGFYPYPSSASRGKFPSLRRLHLHGNRNPHGLLQVGSLTDVCPKLTHLRISGLSMAVSFAWELEEALRAESEGQTKSLAPCCLFPSSLPKSVQHVLVQPVPDSMVSKFGATALLKEKAMMLRLEGLVFAGEGGDRVKAGEQRRFSLLPRDVKDIATADFRRWWLERLDSGRGCWTSC